MKKNPHIPHIHTQLNNVCCLHIKYSNAGYLQCIKNPLISRTLSARHHTMINNTNHTFTSHSVTVVSKLWLVTHTFGMQNISQDSPAKMCNCKYMGQYYTKPTSQRRRGERINNAS